MLLESSPMEMDIPFQSVSGAPYARLPLEKQRFYKERDSLEQFEKQACPEIKAVYQGMIASPKDWCYRNKMEYSFSAILWDRDKDESVDEFGLGFKRRGMWWAAENLLRPSGLFDEAFEKALIAIRELCIASGLPAWHAPQSKGFFRSILVRKSFLQDKFMVALMTSSDGLDQFDLDGFLEKLHELLPGRIASVFHTLSDSQGDRFDYSDEANTLIYGEDHLKEHLLGLDFKMSLASFFQTNPASAEKLYSRVIDHVKNYGQDGIVMDLFCGTGTIGQLLAKHLPGRKIIGVDVQTSSIRDAKNNAALNGIEDVEFIASDVGKFLSEHPQYAGQIGTIVLDPPRNGLVGKTLDKVIALGAKTIVYVSCNPATQARDTRILMDAGYAAKCYELVDQFPHTSHIEGIAVFTM